MHLIRPRGRPFRVRIGMKSARHLVLELSANCLFPFIDDHISWYTRDSRFGENKALKSRLETCIE